MAKTTTTLSSFHNVASIILLKERSEITKLEDIDIDFLFEEGYMETVYWSSHETGSGCYRCYHCYRYISLTTWLYRVFMKPGGVGNFKAIVPSLFVS